MILENVLFFNFACQYFLDEAATSLPLSKTMLRACDACMHTLYVLNSILIFRFGRHFFGP